MKHELLYEVFILEEPAPDAETTIKRASVEGGFYDELLYESYKMTGNIEESKEGDTQMKGWFMPDRWNHQGLPIIHDFVLSLSSIIRRRTDMIKKGTYRKRRYDSRLAKRGLQYCRLW